MKIKQIDENERPRERLISFGVDNLSNEELIAIILKCGTKNISAKDLGNIIIKEINGIENMRDASINKLIGIKGIGKAKAAQLLAAIELGKRVYFVKNKNNIKVISTTEIYEFFKIEFINIKYEKFCVLFLDTKKNIIDFKTVFKGTLDRSVVHPREIFKEAILLSAASIICMHNHPSGDVNPSVEDIEITNILTSGGKLVGINLLDHIIFGNNKYYSFYEEINKKK